MSAVWAVCPSIRPGGGTLPLWSAAGYHVAVCRQGEPFPEADITFPRTTYGGWSSSINFLIKFLLETSEPIDWFVACADDIAPDPHTPDDIAAQLTEHFHGTFGVCQPTGDPWRDAGGRIIERYAGSPWIGREFARRINGGKGPLWPYPHCFSDNEVMEVAQMLGVFWPRSDLTHWHAHWARGAEVKPDWWDATAGADYHASRPLYEARKKAGFPGHEALPSSGFPLHQRSARP